MDIQDVLRIVKNGAEKPKDDLNDYTKGKRDGQVQAYSHAWTLAINYSQCCKELKCDELTTKKNIMNIEEKKAELKRDIDKYSEWLKDCENQYESIKDCVQPKTTELYNGIEKFFSVDKQNGNYEYILGGDGRSQPWSETRSGLIATIKINKGIYLNTAQKKVIKEYVKETHNPDKIVFA